MMIQLLTVLQGKGEFLEIRTAKAAAVEQTPRPSRRSRTYLPGLQSGLPAVNFGHHSTSTRRRTPPLRPALDPEGRRTRFSEQLRRDVGLEALDMMENISVFVKDVDRCFVYYNHAFQDLMSLENPDELIGLRDEEVSPEYLVERYRRDDEEVLKGFRLFDVIELVRNASGGYDWCLTNKSPVRDAAGTVIGLIGVTRKLYAREEEDALASLSGLAPVVELILHRYHRRLTIHELASAACLSASQFTRVFKCRFGISPHAYLRQIRLDAVCELLATSDHKLSLIAELTGFYDQSHMTNAFMTAKGITPREYRQRYRVAHITNSS
jgi:AraC-like DNA-binding protein/PAS domain-containing protein